MAKVDAAYPILFDKDGAVARLVDQAKKSAARESSMEMFRYLHALVFIAIANERCFKAIVETGAIDLLTKQLATEDPLDSLTGLQLLEDVRNFSAIDLPSLIHLITTVIFIICNSV